ncbi:hypothetical protein WJX73_007233 [Symbiochloris irregularis]|uniref:EF-hand domain-containing protein n=1 Tax=Symbiochloris irregularis TaxID=706552 RepID=A0AAW1PWI7_9CHLO
MGQAMSFGLTQYDVEELMEYCGGKFSQAEIEGLYKRFRSLDRGHKGYISAEEFMNIPELSINPLARRLERMFETVNFKDFVGILAAFSKRASRDDRVRFIFTVFDMDGDGHVGAEDLDLMLRQLAGQSLSEEDISTVVKKALQEASTPAAGLSYDDFKKLLQGSQLLMQVEVPSDT